MDTRRIADKYFLAVETAHQEQPNNGQCGLELEWNLLDEQFRPLLTVGSGPSEQSFVDYLRTQSLPEWARVYSQLEVFHWMIEWVTRPYYDPRGAVYESRLLEGVLMNALHRAGRKFSERLYHWSGNLPYATAVNQRSIPGAWHIAKRRYLERCVELYGPALATAGTHSNLSLPAPLLMWDFMHLSPTERAGVHLDTFTSEFYITATRLMRAFTSLFIAVGAATPLRAEMQDGVPIVRLTKFDSVRNLTFPNPASIDIPDLYRSLDHYLMLSGELVRRGIRFGNNNWTPVRARSFAEPVERLIAITSEQLRELYARGLFSLGAEQSLEDMAAEVENENMLTRLALPMARVEIRTDDGGVPLSLEIASLVLKHLLLLRFYADEEFGREFRYDAEDLRRARNNETAAARDGLRAEIAHPLTGKRLDMRSFLRWTITEVQPLAVALGYASYLEPLVEMAAGGLNQAEKLRLELRKSLGANAEVPLELLQELAGKREALVKEETTFIAGAFRDLKLEGPKLAELLQWAREDVHPDPTAPVRFRPQAHTLIDIHFPDKTSEILALAQELIRIPSVTASPQERIEDVRRAGVLIYDYARAQGLGARMYEDGKYPAILIGFPEQMLAPVMLSGHFDVVEPEPDDSQFNPVIDGDYLWGRGAADMKTVVATYLVWMKDFLRRGAPYPPMNLLLVGNEENGETEPMGTPHILNLLENDHNYLPELFIAGERTGERGDELWGEVCLQNRGVMRCEIVARAVRAHTGTKFVQADLTERLLSARAGLTGLIGKYLTLSSPDGWQSQARFPFIQVGRPGIYNISADYGSIGLEVRPIPQDDLAGLVAEMRQFCDNHDLELLLHVNEPGIACDPANPFVQHLLGAVKQASRSEPRIAKKLPGTSARFAPGGQGVVWGQTGIGPHSAQERHYIPSILPYYQALECLASEMLATQ